MAKQAESTAVKRTKTKYTGIYFNESTKRYDVKYNYTVLDVATGKNAYKSKWQYGFQLLKDAQVALADMKANGVKAKETEITFEGALELWLKYAKQKNLSASTVRNTKQHYQVITKYIPKYTKLKNLTEDIYLDAMSSARADGYSEESLHSYNATFRKFVRLAYRKKLISTNFLDLADNFPTEQKKGYRLVTHEEYELLDQYFAKGGFVRQGVDNFKEYRLLIAILYYCGLRIGEALSITMDDFVVFDHNKKGKGPKVWVAVTPADTKREHLPGKNLIVKKSLSSTTKQIKGTKNKKDRTIPISAHVDYLLGHLNKSAEYQSNPSSRKERIFVWTDGAVNDTLKRACQRLGIPKITCHDFRHTFISNLIRKSVPISVIEKVSGDTQETILKRYSHMFEQDEKLVLEALQDL